MIDLEFDKRHIWHPYTSMVDPLPVYPVESARGVHIHLEDGTRLIDGMASWWCMIHGYSHERLTAAICAQAEKMPHVMFGGITHEPAVRLARLLHEITPPGLERIFFSDSGSVAVEVAIKMAFQYWINQGVTEKRRLLSLRGAYHGDTFAAMSVCDPVTGMHDRFAGLLWQHHFADSPACRFDEPCRDRDIAGLAEILRESHEEIAAVIVEPIVQATGGMKFYSPDYLRRLRTLCDEYGVLLIHDEIATGFGRSGKLFACEHAGIEPDIMCIGKAMTGGHMTLAATLCNDKVSDGISRNGGVFMHGPTFMANPLACATAIASIELLLESDWRRRVSDIETQLKAELEPCRSFASVADVRVLGAIGVVEMRDPVDMADAQKFFVSQGVWIRPFGRLVYIMPPYITEAQELRQLTRAIAAFCQR